MPSLSISPLRVKEYSTAKEAGLDNIAPVIGFPVTSVPAIKEAIDGADVPRD